MDKNIDLDKEEDVSAAVGTFLMAWLADLDKAAQAERVEQDRQALECMDPVELHCRVQRTYAAGLNRLAKDLGLEA